LTEREDIQVALEDLGQTVDDGTLAQYAIKNLPKGIKDYIKDYESRQDLCLDDVRCVIGSYFRDHKDQEEEDQKREMANSTRGETRTENKCVFCGKAGHVVKECYINPNSKCCREKWMETAVDQTFQRLNRMPSGNKDKVRAAVTRKRKREEQRDYARGSDTDISDDEYKSEIGLFANLGTKRRKYKGDLPKYLYFAINLLIGFFALLVTSFGAPKYTGVQHWNGSNSKVVSLGESEMHLYSMQTLALVPIIFEFVHWKYGFREEKD
jgi:hypothetical protein